MVLYQEIVVGGTAYPSTPQWSTLAACGVSAASLNKTAAWSPEFHQYRVVNGASGGDVMISFDGKNDHARVPFGPDSAGGLVLPLVLPVYYQQVWARLALAGATAVLGGGLYTKQ